VRMNNQLYRMAENEGWNNDLRSLNIARASGESSRYGGGHVRFMWFSMASTTKWPNFSLRWRVPSSSRSTMITERLVRR
jgi:hypothetical protein